MKRLASVTLVLMLLICVLAVNVDANSSFDFVHITDLHVADSYSAGSYDLDGEGFRQVRDAINALNPKPAFVVASGDISHAGDWGWTGMYPALTQHLYPSSIYYPAPGDYRINQDPNDPTPIYFVPGNHDFRTTNVPPIFIDKNLSDYTRRIGPKTDYILDEGNAVIIFMNCGYDDIFSFIGSWWLPESKGINADQYNWLEDTLQTHEGKRKIIVIHNPPANNTRNPADGSISSKKQGGVNYRAAFLDLCDTFDVDVVLAGHTHHNVVVDRNGDVVDRNWTGGTRYVQTSSTLQGCYRIISVDGFVSVGDPICIPIN